MESTKTATGMIPEYTRMAFTKDCEQAMFNESLAEFAGKISAMRLETITVVRNELSAEDRIRAINAIVDLTEYLYTVEYLQKAGANAKKVWNKTLRAS